MKIRDDPRLRGRWPPPLATVSSPLINLPLKLEDILSGVDLLASDARNEFDISMQTRSGGLAFVRTLTVYDHGLASYLLALFRSRGLGRSIAEIGELEVRKE